MSAEHEGIYLAYFTAEFGTSLGIFLIKDNIIAGGDIGGAKYSGHLKLSKDKQSLIGDVNITMPSGGTTITGAHSDLPVSYDTPVQLHLPLDGQPFHSIQTRTGTVNVRLERTVAL